MAAASTTGQLKKLTITPYKTVKGEITGKKTDILPFTVMLNPSTYSQNLEITYNSKQGMGQDGSEVKYKSTTPQKITLDIFLDGTGVVADATTSVDDQLKALKKVVYDYSGSDHEPNHVRILWGSLLFWGRLESMNVTYTLFKPSGEPLRAKVKLNFAEFEGRMEEALRNNRNSPDLTHMVEVKAGDTLPILCQQVYSDSSYYLEVARVNNISHFRDIKPGQKLYFPPLR